MALMSKWLMESLSDRLAVQAEAVLSGLDSARGEGGGRHYKRIHSGVGLDGDYTLENTLITTANAQDTTALTDFTILSTIFGSYIAALETHARNYGATNLDQWLFASGIDVDWPMSLVYRAKTGSHLDSVNVFGGRVQLGSVALTGSGVSSYTDLNPVGTGSGDASAYNKCAARMTAVVQSGIGANDIVLDVRLLDEAGQATSRQVSFTAAAVPGDEARVGSAGDYFIDITSVVVAGGDNGDAVSFRSEKQRNPAL